MNKKKIILLFLIIVINACTKQKEFSINVLIQHDSVEFNKRKKDNPLSTPLRIGYDTTSRIILTKINIKNQRNQAIKIITRYEVLAVYFSFYEAGIKKENVIITDIYEKLNIKPDSILSTHIIYPVNADSVFYGTPILLDTNNPKKSEWLVTKFIKNKDKKIVFDSYKIN